MFNLELPDWAIEIYGSMIISIGIATIYAGVLYLGKNRRVFLQKISNITLAFLAWVFILFEKIEYTMEELNAPVSSRLFTFLLCAAAITCVNVWTTETGELDS